MSGYTVRLSVALFMMGLSQHLPSKGQLVLFLTLHCGVVRGPIGHTAVAHFDVLVACFIAGDDEWEVYSKRFRNSFSFDMVAK